MAGGPRSEEQKKEYMRKLLKDKDGSLIDLSAFKSRLNKLLGRLRTSQKGKERKIMRQTPEDVKIREEAAARCKRVMERRVLSKQARRVRAHLVKCSMVSGRKKNRRKALLELFVDGTFTDNREEWQKELKRHCKSVHTDQEETEEVQKERIEYFKMKGDRHLLEEGRAGEMTVDLVLQARAKLSNNKVSVPADAVVSEMIKALPLEEVHVVAKCFQQRFMGAMEAPDS